MGKRVKTKAKNPRKAQPRPAAAAEAGSGDAAPLDASSPRKETTAADAAAKDRERCGHYTSDSAHLDKVLLEIISSKHTVACEHCREETPGRRGGGKEKGKQQKKKGGGARGAAAAAQAKGEKSVIWVCLDCGRHFCGGVVSESVPYGHARRHAKQDRHWWAARYDDPTAAYCLSCDAEVPVEMPKVETAAPVAADDKVVVAVGGGVSGFANGLSNVIRGLPNLGNTCFFNSVLQSLLALDTLRKRMLGPDVPTGPLAMSLKKLFMETGGADDTGGALSPKNLFSNICSKSSQFRGNQQQDSHELLRCLLDGLHTEETDARKLDVSSDMQEKVAPKTVAPTIVDSIFGGQLSSTVSCMECTHTSVVHEPFLDLSLPVPSKKPQAKSVASPPPKRSKQSIRDKNKSRRFHGKITSRVSPTVEESNKGKSDTIAECNDSQVPGSELGQVISEKALEPSYCSESCASVPNQEQKKALNVEDSMCWLDYVADTDSTKSEILDSGDSTKAGQVWQSKDAIQGSLQSQVDPLPNDQVLSSEHSGENVVEDAVPLQAVILLPYKDFDVTAEEMDGTTVNPQNPEDIGPPPAVSPVTETGAQTASGGDAEQEVDYDGLGDMFNETEVTSEAKKETGTVEDIDVMAWSSNSADDEVDDSNAPVSVEGCLAMFTKPELLTGEHAWHCERCSEVVLHLNAKERKDSEQMMASANERKDGELMASVGCSDNVNPHVDSKEDRSAKPSLVDAENSSDDNFLVTGNTNVMDTNATADGDQTEQSDIKTGQKEQAGDLNNSAVECTSLCRQPHGSDFQHNDGRTMERAAEEINADSSDSKNSASCNTGNNKDAECGEGGQDAVTSSLPAKKEANLSSAHDNENVSMQNQDRRKRMKLVGKAHQVQESKNNHKENEKNKVMRDAMKRFLISKMPAVLTIHLKRFSQDSRGRLKKLRGHVSFQEILDLRPFTDPRSKENDNCNYHLVGVVEHLGNMGGGHYVAYVRADKIGGRQQQSSCSQSWFYASDAQVKEVSLTQVLKCEAYILFYERVEG